MNNCLYSVGHKNNERVSYQEIRLLEHDPHFGPDAFRMQPTFRSEDRCRFGKPVTAFGESTAAISKRLTFPGHRSYSSSHGVTAHWIEIMDVGLEEALSSEIPSTLGQSTFARLSIRGQPNVRYSHAFYQSFYGCSY